ncbi:MAG: hypothetical protein ACI89X_000341 [Planctomycetota bacterium]|jgi:hypothetical protein
MFIAATLSLLATTLAPQNSAESSQEGKPVLAAREQTTLSDKLRKYLSAEIKYDSSSGKAREKASKARRKAKDSFDKEWAKANKKGILGSMIDLKAVFHNCFENKRPEVGKGNFYMRKVADSDFEYGLQIPKKYKENTPWTTLVVLPSGSAGTWTKPKDYFSKIWAGTELLKTTIVHMPMLPQGLEMDPIPDYTRDGAEKEEQRRIGSVFLGFGFVMNNYNVDRSRVFLDCGKQNSGYGVRLVSLFPDRFAGVILRDPTEVDDIRIGNLLNVPVLVMETDANATKVAALKKRWDEKCPNMMTVMKAKGAAPHLESAAEIEAWMADKKRTMTPKKITLEPNHDRFNKTYWIGISVADSLLTADPDKKPRLEAVADRAANRITIDAQGVERLEILLNDDLVDLSKEFTIVINGKAIKETRRRSFRDMKRRMMQRNDWSYLFPVSYIATVPKE